jgi:hypothetical protein
MGKFLAGLIAMAVVALPLLVFGGDLTSPQQPPPGSSRAFRDGYTDGCLTGFQDARRDGYQQSGRKDAERYLRDPDYKAGYDAAYKACYEEERRNPKMLNL